MVDALVLSGGASHGDFEVGAVRRLFEAGFQPALIVSASVGSINAVKLCEMGTLAAAGEPSGLEQIWRGLQNNNSMYVKNSDFDTSAFNQAVFAPLQGFASNLQNDYDWRNIGGRAAGGAAAGATAGSALGPTGTVAGALIGAGIGLATSIIQSGNDLSAFAAAAQPLMDALQKLLKAQSVYKLDPIRNTMSDQTVLDPEKVKNSPIQLLMAVVSLGSGDLRYITGSGAVMREDTATPYSERHEVNPNCQNDQDDYNATVADLQEVERTRGDYSTYADWRAAILNAQTAVGTAKAALGACERANPGPVMQPVSTDVRTGVIASASIPMIFVPVKIGNDNYVDGGTRNQVPITGAIAAGATRIWAVDCNHPALGPGSGPIQRSTTRKLRYRQLPPNRQPRQRRHSALPARTRQRRRRRHALSDGHTCSARVGHPQRLHRRPGPDPYPHGSRLYAHKRRHVRRTRVRRHHTRLSQRNKRGTAHDRYHQPAIPDLEARARSGRLDSEPGSR